MTNKISALVLGFNCERSIERCLKSLVGFDEIIVIDSGSTDKTKEICNKYNVKWIVNKFEGFSEQRNFATEQAAFDWCLFVDSDEEVTSELKALLYRTIAAGSGVFYPLYRIYRTEYILRKEVATGSCGSGYQERFFRRERVRFAGHVHEYPMIDGVKPSSNSPLVGNLCKSCRLKHDLDNDVTLMFSKLGKYSILKAMQKKEKNKSTNAFMVFFTFPIAFIKFYLKSWREGRRGIIVASVEALHRTMVNILLYEQKIINKEKI